MRRTITWIIGGVAIVALIVGLTVAFGHGTPKPKTHAFNFDTAVAPTGTCTYDVCSSLFCHAVPGHVNTLLTSQRGMLWLLIGSSPTPQIHAEMVDLYEHPHAATVPLTEAYINAQLSEVCA
jgi:hypothetical protein